MNNNKQQKNITVASLVLMIITTVYGFGNVSVSYEQMTYAGIIWFILAGVCFFFPAGLMMAEYGSAFHDAQGGIYSWLAGSIGEKWAFIGTFVWLSNWVLWLVASASRLWISISALIFGKDTTQSWHLFGLHGTQLIGVLAILFMIVSTYLSSRGMTGIKIMSSIGGIFMIVMNAIFIIASLIIICMNHGQFAQPITGWQSFIISPNKSFQTPITIISFVVYAVFAYGGMETVGGVINNMKKPEKEFPKGLIIGSIFTIVSYVLMIFMTGFSVNYNQDILHGNANTGNITYIVYGTLGRMFGQAFNLNPHISCIIGKIFTRAIALSGLIGMMGAFFVLLYSPVKSFIMGSNPKLWPKKATKLNKNGIPANAMWAQSIFVCLLIAVVSFGGSAATSFYQILTDMGNVAATAPYIFLIGAFPFFLKKNYPRDFRVFTNFKWTVTLVVFVEIIVCTGIIFTVIEPVLKGNYMTAFWTGFGPIFFALIAWIFYEVSRRRNHLK
ncbi:MAG: glutamate/gamma-aminobutyrate family transporter YjeM [Candidatus Lactobacillus pullistercoris]|uniref:Glutamate/gamma-aminobutyrate family transporter YjeM n=1 Tax=Candidatus Lactobacillus pullistercoris TaxID=2838636 RepID=A0A9E2KSV7_9LACO|nr:glutamate/gamma-aminobutyrate family transporter YjeM [Candidatus Lactobacillus pullistercoris]